MKRGLFLHEALLQQQPGNEAILTYNYKVMGRGLLHFQKWHSYRGEYLRNEESCRLLAWDTISGRSVLVLLKESFRSDHWLVRYDSLKTTKNCKNA